MENNLGTIMGARLLRVNEVASGAKLSRNVVSSIRNKRSKNVNLATLIALCDFLEIPLHELVDYYPQTK